MQFWAHKLILAATIPIAHTTYGELCQLFETFTKVWEAWRQTSLHHHTQNSQTKAFLEIQLGVPAAPRPGTQKLNGSVMDKHMVPSTKTLLSSSIPGDVAHQLEPLTQHGEKPGYSSARRNSRKVLSIPVQ